MFKDMVQCIYIYKHIMLAFLYFFILISSNFYKITNHNKNYNLLEANIFKGIDLSIIELLNKRLRLLLKNYISNNNINENTIICKNKTLSNHNLKGTEKLINKLITELYHSLDQDFMSWIKDIDDVSIKIHGKIYSKKELSDLILNHNKNLIMPGLNEYYLEKEFLVDWRDYNTSKVKDVTVTPLTGTVAELNITNPLSIYISWIVASHYLLKEYNIWTKAKLYSENIHLNSSEFNAIEYKQAYYYFIVRQFFIQNPTNMFNTKFYIIDFTVNENIYRELNEDMLYILLHLILADKILGNNDLSKSLNNNQKFFDILTNIIQDHYDQNKEGYKCLEYLRWYTCNNFLSVDQIKFLYSKWK